LQMALLENWFEVTRLTFLTWIIFAVVTKEFGAREADQADRAPGPALVTAGGPRAFAGDP